MKPTGDQSAGPRIALVRRLVEAQGFALLGVAPAEASDYASEFEAWLKRGHHGEMSYLAVHVAERMDPRRVLPGARAVICVADWYGDDGNAAETHPRPVGRIARYAWRSDYHRRMKKRLHAVADAMREAWPGFEHRTTVDSAPILEREHAARAGLGWIGKHTLLIHPDRGSWLLLGEVITTLPLRMESQPEPDHCGSCTRCIDACPTHCITPYSVDASRCVSYLTIEHRGMIDPSLHEGMGAWVAGCDVCQEVCPFNQPRGERRAGTHDESSPRKAGGAELAHGLDLMALLDWDESDRRAAFERSALKRIKLTQLKRNALIAAGNQLMTKDVPSMRDRIRAIAEDAQEPGLVRETARQVLARLGRESVDGRGG